MVGVKFCCEELLGKLGKTLGPAEALFARKDFGLPDELSVSIKGVILVKAVENGFVALVGSFSLAV